MPSLHVLQGPGQGQRVDLEAEEVVLGRSPECQVVIPPTSVSRQHARIVRSHGTFFIEDMRSRNGTKVNEQLVSARVELKNGDRIQICDFVALFYDGEHPLPAPSGTDSVMEEATPTSSSGVRSAQTHSSSVFLEIQSAEKLKLILQASNSLRNTLELDQLLPKIADCVLPLFPQAERCFVLTPDEFGKPRLGAVRAKREQDAFIRFNAADALQCLESGQASLSEETRSAAAGRKSAELLVYSSMNVPFCAADGTVLGVLQAVGEPNTRRFNEEDLLLLRGVADQASIALENARLHAELLEREQLELDLELAGQVQRSILPEHLPTVPGYEFFAHYHAALQIGGDYYDFVPLAQQRLAITIGDVAGKGLPAALLMTKLSSDTRYCLLAEADVGAAIGRLNNLLCPHTRRTDRFVTLAVAVLDPAQHSITLTSAAHLAPLLYRRAAGRLEAVAAFEVDGLPLGLERGQSYHTSQFDLQPGDSLLFFTDGVTEAVNVEGKQFRLDGIYEAVRGGGPFTPASLGDRVIKSVQRHAAGRGQHDDITLVCFGRL
jgi:sigma-B regulation protein RsbU (phosphoserine phosphatase)